MQSDTPPERRGRPRVKRNPNERVPMSVRVRGGLFNQLNEAAQNNDWPLGREVEIRLERSFDPILPHEDRDLMMALHATYKHGGLAAALRLMVTTLGNPDADEIAQRWELAFGALQSIARAASTDPKIEKSGYRPPEPQQ